MKKLKMSERSYKAAVRLGSTSIVRDLVRDGYTLGEIMRRIGGGWPQKISREGVQLALALDNLPHGWGAQIDRIGYTQRKRAASRPVVDLRNTAERHADRLQQQTDTEIRGMLRQWYSMPSKKWVGGNVTIVTSRSAAYGVQVKVEKVWHKKHTWQGTNLELFLRMSPAWRASGACEMSQQLGRIVTHMYDRGDRWQCFVLRQSGRTYKFAVEAIEVAKGQPQ